MLQPSSGSDTQRSDWHPAERPAVSHVWGCVKSRQLAAMAFIQRAHTRHVARGDKGPPICYTLAIFFFPLAVLRQPL